MLAVLWWGSIQHTAKTFIISDMYIARHRTTNRHHQLIIHFPKTKPTNTFAVKTIWYNFAFVYSVVVQYYLFLYYDVMVVASLAVNRSRDDALRAHPQKIYIYDATKNNTLIFYIFPASAARSQGTRQIFFILQFQCI